ncbi:MAG: septum site-determining protein MinD, partial [Methanomicrobiaceae archaeon]|nr:septum site-determining protein MinD [Methanomicrobiaceae archaeon]
RAQMQNLLGVRVIGFIPEDPYVRRSSAARMPVVLKYPSSDASQAFSRISAGLAGIEYQAEEAVANASREGFVDRLARVLFRGKT